MSTTSGWRCWWHKGRFLGPTSVTASCCTRSLLARHTTRDILLVQSDLDIIDAGLELLKTVRVPQDKRVSFVDCLVMAYARLYNTREIFGFDAVFVQNGYQLPGKAEKKAA